MYDLVVDGFRVILAMKSHEYFFYKGLLVRGKRVAESWLGDVPVIVDLQAQRVVKIKTDSLSLFVIQALEELSDQCFRRGRLALCCL